MIEEYNIEVMEEDYSSVNNVKKWLDVLKKKGNFSCARLMPFNISCENCACYCRMTGRDSVTNCVLRYINIKLK